MREVLPDDQSEDRFRQTYRQHLDRQSPQLIALLRATLARTDRSPDVTGAHLEVFPDEYGDGFVSVQMYFTGRHPQVRKSDSSLYCGASLSLTDDIAVPLLNPDTYPFDTADVSVGVVIEWVSDCWTIAGGKDYGLPVTITGHDGLGTPDLLPLNQLARDQHRSPTRGSRAAR